MEKEGFYAKLPYYCSIYERNTKTILFNFSLTLNFTLAPKIKNRILDLTIKKVEVVDGPLHMYEVKEFPQIRPLIIDYHLMKFLEEMLEGKTFGSNFAIKADSIEIREKEIILSIYD